MTMTTTSRCNCFFIIIIPRKCLEGLNPKIPDNFTRRFGGGLSNPIFLKPPDGTEWKVYWTKNECAIWFQKGWKEFATYYYSLDYGHLLLFEYEGNPHFEVHIFDMSALEIEYPFHSKICDDSVEILREQSPCKKKRLKSPMLSTQPHRTEVESSPNVQNMLQHAQIKDGKSTKRTSQLISPRPGTSGNVKEAKQFTSENPFFMINIRQSHLEKITYPSLSTDFVRKYFETKKKQNVMIKFGKKLWSVNVLYYPSNGKASFGAGWFRFAEESKLQAGDVCIFELINMEEAVLALHIYRGHN